MHRSEEFKFATLIFNFHLAQFLHFPCIVWIKEFLIALILYFSETTSEI